MALPQRCRRGRHDFATAAESPKAPEAETLDKGVAALVAAYPKGDVARYFWTLLWQDPETWGGLQGRPELAV